MRRIQLFLLMAVGTIFAACNKNGGPTAMTFEVYEQESEANNLVNGEEWKGTIKLCFDVPVGDEEAQENAVKGILDIIGKSDLAKHYGPPTGNTLKEVADNYVNKYKEIFRQQQSFDESFYYDPTLSVRCVYQNEACVVMEVTEGYFNKTYEGVIRLSDGHLLTNDEIANISKEELLELAHKYADATQDEKIRIEDDYNLSIGPQGLLFHPSQDCKSEFVIPMSEVESKLTEEAKALMTAKDVFEEQELQLKEPIKGDLALYGVRGPVKQLKIINDYVTTTYTFDTNGWLTSEKHEMDGEVIDDKTFYERSNRDAHGRAIERFREGNFVKEINTYNDMGQLVKQEYWVGDRLEQLTINYYDNQNRLYKTNEKLTVHGTLYTSITTKSYFSDCQYDKYGNSIEKKGLEEKRVITYYEGN